MKKTQYVCDACGGISLKWVGCCPDCQAWNTLQEVVALSKPAKSAARMQGYAGATVPELKALSEVMPETVPRLDSGFAELNRVLGGGLVAGSVVLIGGDPGIGKSTLLLQALAHLSQSERVLYVTGEESLEQISLRAHRLGLQSAPIQLLSETHLETILNQAQQHKPTILVIDSIQTLHTDLLQAAPGSVSQVRETAATLVQFAKQTHTAVFLIGHVTKEGALAGPRVLEHMVDAVLYFEGQTDSRYRVIRAFKNRFGAVNELGIFGMTDKGLKEVANPSAIFLSGHDAHVSGSVIMATWEGSRPMLVEMQALMDPSHGGVPRRVSLGIDPNRLTMMLAILHRHAGIVTYDQDIFVNMVGGVRITETGCDLALMVALLSSLRNRALPRTLLCFGEVGLGGEIRPVPGGHERLREAHKHGFTKAIVPRANAKGLKLDGLEIIDCAHIQDALAHV